MHLSFSSDGVSLLPQASQEEPPGALHESLDYPSSMDWSQAISPVVSENLQSAVLSVTYHLLPHRTGERIENFESHSGKFLQELR